ncbi:MAG: DUF4870 domain-containing protein [Vicinamibacterales bacterium]
MSAGREPSTTGLDPHVAATLAYLAGPFSGVLVLLAERTNPYVRFHAWQSVIGLGGLGVIVALLLVLSFASLMVSATAFRTLLVASWVAWALWIVCWGICVVKAFSRRRWKLPIAGAYAERLSGRPTGTSSPSSA